MSTLKDVDFLDGAEEELAATNPQERNWRGIVIALLVIAAMCSLIGIAILILTPLNTSADGPHLKMSLGDVLGLNFLSPVESMNWLDDHRIVVKMAESVDLIDVGSDSLENKTILTTEQLFRYGKVNLATITPNEKFIVLLYSATKKSPKHIYKVFDRETGTFENVGPTKSGDENVKFLLWNGKGDDFAYVKDNDVYYQTSPCLNNSKRLTNTGGYNLFNGVADWLYQEEIFQTTQALWWSLDGEQLAFLTIDNHKVRHYDLTFYDQHQYPTSISQAYPKVDSPNLPKVDLQIFSKSEGILKKLKVLAEESLRIYLLSASWIEIQGQSLLVAVWSNRYQNNTLITLCSFKTGICVPNFSQKYAFDNGLKLWAEPEEMKIRFHTNNSYFVLLPHQRPNGKVFTHIARIDTPNRDLRHGRESFLPAGDYDIGQIDYLDEENNKLYFTASSPLPSQRHLFVTDIYSNEQLEAQCITCNISPNCTFHDSSFNPPQKSSTKNNLRMFLNCKGPGTPHVILAQIDRLSSKITLISSDYAKNKGLEEITNTYLLPTVKMDNVTLKNGYVSKVKMLLPHGLTTTGTIDKIYPVLINVYAGPGSQKVTDEWLAVSIDMYFASALDYVVVFIDGRGSGHQGWHVKNPIYGNLGTVEVDDQLETIRELLKRYHFLDSTKVGIWGWSYGGFVSARAVQRDNNETIKCAASVAPVTNFKYYDATYTERYMGGASWNAYEKTDLTQNVSAFHKVPYLLAHGTSDDNVHFQNTAEFAKALTDENVQFQLMIYTDDTHNLSSGRWHLYNMLSDFFKRCFKSN